MVSQDFFMERSSEGVQKMREHQDLEIILQPQLVDGVQQHCYNIDKVKHCQDCQKLVEWVLELLPEQEEDGDGVPHNSYTGYQALQHSFKEEMQIYQLC